MMTTIMFAITVILAVLWGIMILAAICDSKSPLTGNEALFALLVEAYFVLTAISLYA